LGFSWVDYLILIVYALGITLFGARFGKSQQSLKDYFLGGQDLPWWAICFSIVATETSTLTFIGSPAISYRSNLTFLQLTFGYLLGRIIVSLVLIPAYFRRALFTSYQLLHERFGAKAKNFSAALFLLTRALSDGVRLYATGLVLAITTQMGVIPAVVLMGMLTIYYTFKGGMVAVVWTDVIQMTLYLGGAGLAVFEILQRIPGGWESIRHSVAPLGKLQVLDLSFDVSRPYTLWAGLIGGIFITLASHGTDQLTVQRFFACRSKVDAQKALITSGFVILFQFLLFLIIGVMLYAFYLEFPLTEPLSKPDEIFPRFIVQELPHGASGLVIAAIFAAAMSTLSGSLNSLSGTLLNDFYKPYIRPHESEGHYLKASKLMTIVWGIILIGIAILARQWGSVLETALTIMSFTAGSMVGIFLLAVLTHRANQAGGLGGMILGLLALSAVHFLPHYGYLPRLAWTWYVCVGSVTTFVSGLLLSKFFDGSPNRGKRTI
jgi:solute:Na+ symporter, SSS family